MTDTTARAPDWAAPRPRGVRAAALRGAAT